MFERSDWVCLKLREMEELDTLLDLSGHGREGGPPTPNSVLVVLDTDIATWSPSKIREVHSKHEIHIVPSKPTGRTFTHRTCVSLGINMDHPLEVHGKSFAIGWAQC